MTKTADDRYLTVAQAAELASVSEATIRRWARNGLLTKHRVRGLQSVRIRESEVHELITPVTPTRPTHDQDRGVRGRAD